MIKRILSIGMIMTIMFLSISIVYAVEKQNGTTPVDNDKMIEYLNSDSKKRLLLRDMVNAVKVFTLRLCISAYYIHFKRVKVKIFTAFTITMVI